MKSLPTDLNSYQLSAYFAAQPNAVRHGGQGAAWRLSHADVRVPGSEL